MAIIILCDSINSGKSTFCLKLAKDLVKDGRDVSGFVTPAYIIDGEKRGHDFISIDHGKISAPIPFTREKPFGGSFPMFRYHFNPRAFEIAATLSGDFFVMDEIGPLELDHLKGFYDTLKKAVMTAKVVLAVVRDNLKDQFANELAPITPKFYTLAEAHRKSCFPDQYGL